MATPESSPVTLVASVPYADDLLGWLSNVTILDILAPSSLDLSKPPPPLSVGCRMQYALTEPGGGGGGGMESPPPPPSDDDFGPTRGALAFAGISGCPFAPTACITSGWTYLLDNGLNVALFPNTTDDASCPVRAALAG